MFCLFHYCFSVLQLHIIFWELFSDISIIVVSSVTHAPELTKIAMPVSEQKMSCHPFTRRLDAPQSQFKPRSEDTVSFTRCRSPKHTARNLSVSRNVLAHDTWTCAYNNFEMKMSEWCCRMWRTVIYHFCIIFVLCRRPFFTVTYLYR